MGDLLERRRVRESFAFCSVPAVSFSGAGEGEVDGEEVLVLVASL